MLLKLLLIVIVMVITSVCVCVSVDIIQGLMDKYKEVAAIKALEDFCEDKGEEGENDEQEDDVWDEAARLEDTKKKLRLVLCQADFRNLPWLMSKDRIISTRY